MRSMVTTVASEFDAISFASNSIRNFSCDFFRIFAIWIFASCWEIRRTVELNGEFGFSHLTVTIWIFAILIFAIWIFAIRGFASNSDGVSLQRRSPCLIPSPLSFGAGPSTTSTALSAFGAGHSASPLTPSGTLATALSAFGAGHSGSPLELSLRRRPLGYRPQRLRRRPRGFSPQRLRRRRLDYRPQRLRHRPLGSPLSDCLCFSHFQPNF